ncbi:cobalt-precorrin-5B (C(1))-methyltransferase [Marinomonas rhizomae]|uniref:Cobalt-precorrin-5B C(1)-methyltransferase n=1 Tax=Marinomonas rhizomae TaxID=491948 RepID=A0A366J887_9GAMM|nr:cobalt-precorrin-5B (C(1))-methyltransferase [Marinomonas rhizomae]RBP82569.1 cobalt-precorrin-5B (C1)-methyltransferase [Marinomonas rhizomae]RNF73646.1 cobalt-precorrin-5B (C(1))-methyltransferase [Marinomonas rhizomae]
MWPESAESPAPLRTGLTTGTCATACCVAAAQALFAQQQDSSVSVTLPKGKVVDLPIIEYQAIDDGIKTATIKDAGDDPDATHGATLFVELRLSPEQGVRFHAAQGVGTVTRTGLLLDVGEPAINPVPRKMMTEHLEGFAQTYQYHGGFDVSVGVINGEQIAQKTMNPRLGILGGLSILGTTGIVRPFSCAAYIASIHQGIDVARANSITHIAATTGNASEDAIKSHYQLDDMALIEMGDFVGAVLKHIKKVEQASSSQINSSIQLQKLSICGGFGKISKLAQHHMDLNSRASSIDLAALAQLAASLGAEAELQERMTSANTSVEALSFAMSAGLALADAICQQASDFARQYIPAHIELEVWAIDRKGQFVGKALDTDLTKRGEL